MTFAMEISPGDEDDSVGECGVSLDVIEVGGNVCSMVNSMTGCDEIQSVAVVGSGVDTDGRTTWSWWRCGSRVGERSLNLTPFSWGILRSGKL